MPIYEYLCPACHRVYSFLARTMADAERRPRCPRCGGDGLRRQASRFHIGRPRSGARADGAAGSEGFGGEGGLGDLGPADDPRLERAMMRLARDAEALDGRDGRGLAALLRRMGALTGEGLDAATEVAVRRLEAGEDPARVEEELGEALDGGLLGAGGGGGGLGPPAHDDGLYEL